MTATIRVTNISEKVTEKDIHDFFAFSGEIKHIQIGKEPGESKQYAYVTFQEERALDTALLLTDAVMADSHIIVEPAEGYINPDITTLPDSNKAEAPKSTVNRAEDVISGMLAKGYILGVDTLSKAKAFDKKHGLTQTASTKAYEFGGKASATASDLDRKLGISARFSAGATTVNQSLQSFDQKYQLVAKTKGALSTAEQKINEAGSALMRFQAVAKGANWISSTFSRVAKVAEDVTVKTREKVQKTEVERNMSKASDQQIDMELPAAISDKPESKSPVSAPSDPSPHQISPASVDNIPDKING